MNKCICSCQIKFLTFLDCSFFTEQHYTNNRKDAVCTFFTCDHQERISSKIIRRRILHLYRNLHFSHLYYKRQSHSAARNFTNWGAYLENTTKVKKFSYYLYIMILYSINGWKKKKKKSFDNELFYRNICREKYFEQLNII